MRIFCLFIFYLFWLLGLAQSRVDSLLEELQTASTEVNKIKVLHQLMGTLVNQMPDSAMFYAREAFQRSAKIDDPVLHGQSYMNLTHCYFVLGHMDSCRNILLEALKLYESSGQTDKEAAVYRNLAVLGEVQQQPDTSLYYLDRCLEVLERAPNKNILGDVYLSKGFAYRTKGFYNLSLEALLEALRIFEENGSINQMGYVCQNLGIVYHITERLEEASKQYDASCDYFLQQENLRAFAQSKNNLGKIYKEDGKFVLAQKSHYESIQYAQQTNQPDVTADNYWNLGRMYFEQNRLDSAESCFRNCELVASEIADSFLLGGVLRWKSKIALLENNRTLAENYLKQSFNYLKEYYDPSLTREAYEDLADIYTGLDRPGQALTYTLQATTIKDSLYTLKKEQQFEELNLIYETEKKDAEIQLLAKNAELDLNKKRSLWTAVFLLLILGSAIIYFLIQRRKKDQKIFLQEKELAVEKRKNLEQELEYKKKELMGRVLQLAKKNEFLLDLEKQITDLNTNGDKQIKRKSNRMSRMIYHQTANDDDWDQFVAEFSSVHQDFMEKFIERHGPFSKSEIRLITLFKMNLSSKDIANTLRISSDGIKKARYRLRKKLDLDSDVDIQSYILSFN